MTTTAAARDTSLVNFERYMIDRSNRHSDVRQMAFDRIHWFFALDRTGHRQYFEDTATDACINYRRGDMTMSDQPVAR